MVTEDNEKLVLLGVYAARSETMCPGSRASVRWSLCSWTHRLLSPLSYKAHVNILSTYLIEYKNITLKLFLESLHSSYFGRAIFHTASCDDKW